MKLVIELSDDELASVVARAGRRAYVIRTKLDTFKIEDAILDKVIVAARESGLRFIETTVDVVSKR